MYVSLERNEGLSLDFMIFASHSLAKMAVTLKRFKLPILFTNRDQRLFQVALLLSQELLLFDDLVANQSVADNFRM